MKNAFIDIEKQHEKAEVRWNTQKKPEPDWDNRRYHGYFRAGCTARGCGWETGYRANRRTWPESAPTAREFQQHVEAIHVLAHPVDPELLAVVKKPRITHEYWLYVKSYRPFPKIIDDGWRARPIWDVQKAMTTGQLQWWTSATAPWVVLRKQRNGIKPLGSWYTREAAVSIVHQDLRSDPNEVELFGEIDLEGVQPLAASINDYVAHMIQMYQNTNSTAKMTEALKELNEALEAVEILRELRDDVQNRLFGSFT